MLNSELRVLCALSFGILTLVFFSYETNAVKCTVCKRSQSLQLDGGCEAQEAVEQAVDCQLCAWVITKETRTDKLMGPDGKWIEKEIEAGSIFARGCAFHRKGEAVTFMEGDCVPHLERYYCFCNKPFCNKQLPACEWIKETDEDNADPKGCIPWNGNHSDIDPATLARNKSNR